MFTPPRTVDDLAPFIEQEALLAVLRHVRSDPGRELFGFLLGELYECPESGARYVVIDAALATDRELREGGAVGFPAEQWLAAELEARRRQARILGWYHGSPFVGAHPDRLDLDRHRAHFSDPWQYGLVVSTSGEPAGGFFRPLLGEPTGGGVFTPFHELLSDAPPRAAGGPPRRTVLDWTNYLPQEPVARDEPIWYPPPPSEPAQTSSNQPRFTPQNTATDEPANERSATADGGGAPLPLLLPPPAELEAMLAAAQPQSRGRRGAIVAAALVTVVAMAAAGFYWYRGRLLNLPGGTADFIQQVSAGQLPLGRPAPPLGDSAPAFAPRVGPGAGTAAAAHTPPARSSPPAAAAPTPSTNPIVLRFDNLADSLEQAVRNFHDRGTDFSLNRLTCEGLAVGYRSADVTFIALAAAHRAARDVLDSAREAQYQRLAGQMRGVNEEFDSSKCPRP
jgi:proteasome lid subunit RPN8/RPN11